MENLNKLPQIWMPKATNDTTEQNTQDLACTVANSESWDESPRKRQPHLGPG